MNKQQETKMCILNVPIFQNLSQNEQDAVCLIASHKKIVKGSFIFSPGDVIDSLFVVHQGKVKISKFNEEGKEQVLRVLEPGDFFGETAIFNQELMTSTAEVVEDAVICLIEKEQFKNLIVDSPELSFKMMSELSKRLVKAEDLIENTTIQKAIYRVAHLLVQLEKNSIVKFKLTKQTMALQIGLTPETFSRKLKELAFLGYIKIIDNKTIKILDKKTFVEHMPRL